MPDVENSTQDGTIHPIPVASALPMFDKAENTAKCCKYSLILAWLAAIGCLLIFTIRFSIKEYGEIDIMGRTTLSPRIAEAISFLINIYVTFVTDSAGFIHHTSLRWALYREGRLEFNTNMRLLTSARRSAPNRWPANLLYIASLILCYTATSQIMITSTGGYTRQHDDINQPFIPVYVVWINFIPIGLLGVGLMAQAGLASWCVLTEKTNHIPTWSSNPLNNTLALIQITDTRHIEGRCMMSVHQRNLKTQRSRPQKQQGSLYAVRRSIRYVILFVWSMVVLSIIGFITLVVVIQHGINSENPHSWSLTPVWDPMFTEGLDWAPEWSSGGYNFAFISMMNVPYFLTPVCSILLVCVFQGAQMLVLHCAELVVNISRDESTWRAASRPLEASQNAKSKSQGAKLIVSPLISVVSNWMTVLLFLFKTLLHWLMGQCVQLNSEEYTAFVAYVVPYVRVFVFVMTLVALAVFVTYLAFRSVDGPQPAAWGHLQTLADLIDDWKTDANGTLYWGDKGISKCGIRHAGTSDSIDQLGKIDMEAEYQGITDG